MTGNKQKSKISSDSERLDFTVDNDISKETGGFEPKFEAEELMPRMYS